MIKKLKCLLSGGHTYIFVNHHNTGKSWRSGLARHLAWWPWTQEDKKAPHGIRCEDCAHYIEASELQGG